LHAFLEVWKIASSSRYKTKQNKAQADQPKRILPPIQKNQKKIPLFSVRVRENLRRSVARNGSKQIGPKKHAQLCTPWIVAAESFTRERRERNDEEARRSSSTSQKRGPQIRDPNTFGTSLGGLKSQLSSSGRLVT
jgi:hypothetical protein